MKLDASINDWYSYFFDELYYETYRVFETEERNEKEAKLIIELLNLEPDMRVLDLGCGYARHAVYIAKQGIKVTCFDNSKYLLNIARKRIQKFKVKDLVEIIEGDMRYDISYNEEFDAIYMFFTTFGYFDDSDNEKVLENISKALKPSGKFLLDTINLHRVSYQAYVNGGSWNTWYKAGEYYVLEETKFDVTNGYLYTNRLFYKEGKGIVDSRAFRLRIYPYWELRRMLEMVGLKVKRTLGSYRNDEYNITSPRMIIVAEKT